MTHSLSELLLSLRPSNGRFYLVAIDGRGASGKSTLAYYLASLLPDFILLRGDDYFEPSNDTIAWGFFNDQRFNHDVIDPLKTSSVINYRAYDWHAEPHIKETRIQVNHGLILDRCFSFNFDLPWDLKIWVVTPKDLCFKRGVIRDQDPNLAVNDVWHLWQQAEDEYLRDKRPLDTADLIVDGTSAFETQIIK